jgi:hypothetical protein
MEFKLIEENEIESPSVELHIATGRARCRICGDKIAKGQADVQFYHSLSESTYNPWNATLCHAHQGCVPTVKIEYDRTK